MKIRTAAQFVTAIRDEYSWRHKELIDFRLLSKTSSLIDRSILVRAGIPLAYAHWEGFVKCATELLLNFVCQQSLLNRDLSNVYFAHSVKSEISKIIESKKVNTVVEAATFVRLALSKTAEIRHKGYVDTESNLSSAVFDQIAKSVGVDVHAYTHLYPYIDETIVNTRNKIAHGEIMQFNLTDFHALVDRVAELLLMYKTDLENIVVQSRFKI